MLNDFVYYIIFWIISYIEVEEYIDFKIINLIRKILIFVKKIIKQPN